MPLTYLYLIDLLIDMSMSGLNYGSHISHLVMLKG